jgi:hypothetical protein
MCIILMVRKKFDGKRKTKQRERKQSQSNPGGQRPETEWRNCDGGEARRGVVGGTYPTKLTA